MADETFDNWPGRHPREIDVARKLRTHADDDTRHIDVTDPGTLPPDARDFLLYDTGSEQWFPVAPFAYGQLGFEGTHAQPVTTGAEILAPTGMDFGPHYLVDEPTEGRVRYTGSDLRTARIDTQTSLTITNNNTNVALGVFLDDVLVYDKGGSFSGNQVGAVLEVNFHFLVDLSQDGIVDVRIDTDKACEISLHAIMLYSWPQAAGHIP